MELSLVRGIVPRTVFGLTAIAAIILIIGLALSKSKKRGRLHPLIVSLIAAVLDGATGLLIAWLESDVFMVFGVSLGWPVIFTIAGGIAGVGFVIAAAVTLRGVRRALAVVLVPLVLLSTALGVDSIYGEYQTIGTLVGYTPYASLGSIEVHKAAMSVSDWRSKARKGSLPSMPSQGKVLTVDIPNAKSNFTARKAMIYLPPAAASLQAGPQGVRYGSGTLNGVPLAEAAAALLPQPTAKTNDTPSTAPTHALAVQLAAQCGVLVQNLGALPLRAGQRVAYIGAFAETPRYYGKGQPSPAAIGALNAALLKGRRVGYVTGFPANRDERDEDEFLRAVSAAKHADVAVVFAGLPESFVSPDADRRTLRLPDCQNNLIARIAAVQKNTVVVLHAGAPVECPWAGDVSAVLCMYLAGEGVGEATDALLWGDANPSGRLPETWPLRLEDTPCYLDYPGDGRTADYREGVYVGYRWYDARRMPVLWPFGHGMGYTGFVYRNARLSADTLAEGGEVKVCVTVKNSGAVRGAEVVQLYISDETGAPIAGGRVPQVLRGFSKVWLDPGEERDVEFVLTARDLAHYDPTRCAWHTAPGRYLLRLGHTSRDIRASLGLNFG